MSDTNEATANDTTTGKAEGTAEVKETVKRVKDGDFMRAWQTSNSVAEVVEKTGIKTAGQRAMRLRKRGIALKHMPKGGGAKITPEKTEALKAELEKINAELAKADTDADAS